MRSKILIITLLYSVALVSCGAYTNPMSTMDATPVIRTDFTDEHAWEQIKRAISARYFLGFSANVRFIDDIQYRGLTGEELLQMVPGLKDYGCGFVADETAMMTEEHHVLVLDPYDPTGKTFRVIPSEAWAVENNLSLANMDYFEFADAADPDGVFRGFR